MHRGYRVVTAIFILSVVSFCLPFTTGSNVYVDVTVSEAKNMIESNPSLVILDVRTQSEYQSGHIQNAKLIPHTELENRIGELDKYSETLVYCRSGYRSAIASEILTNHSFQKVYNVEGGILAWKDAGYPVYVRYSSLQQAINNASQGETILVSSGTYNEHVVVNKTVNLEGENPKTTFICGNGTQSVLHIDAPKVNIFGFTIQNGTKGIYLSDSAGFSIVKDCKILQNDFGIDVEEADDNILTMNIIINNTGSAIRLTSCGCGGQRVSGNIVTRNTLFNNGYGIRLRFSKANLVYHNNFINNTQQVSISGPHNTNVWDDGDLGNYWSNYAGTDVNGDGIGDTPYVIDEENQDNYPLMTPITPLYYEMLKKYNNLLVDFQNLNSTYYKLLDNYSKLLTNFNDLNATYYAIQSNYTELQGSYNNLQSSFDSLNSTHNNLVSDYNSLQWSYNQLNSSYITLQDSYDELQSDKEAILGELSTIRNLMYLFIATTIALIATTVYLAIRKPKTIPKRKRKKT